jgi:hypothetical protein
LERGLAVPKLVHGKEYDPHEIRRALGARAAKDAFAVGRDGVALFARIDAGSGSPYFSARSTLEWPGVAPRRAVEAETRVSVFVHLSDDAVRFIGDGRATGYSSGKDLPSDVQFTISPPLTRSAWLELLAGRLPPEGPPPEAPLADLPPGSRPDERWAALTGFLERWHGQSLAEPPAIPGTTTAPPLLRKMLGVQALVPDVVRHNQLVRPEELVLEDGKIVFLVENQGVCLWATEPDGDDPRVWYRENQDRAPWSEERERLSGFLIQAALFEAILHARFGASATALPDDEAEAILALVAPLGAGRWNWGGARFFGADGALVMTMENGEACDVWLAARTPLALSRFEGLVTDEWDRVAF